MYRKLYLTKDIDLYFKQNMEITILLYSSHLLLKTMGNNS